MYKIKAILYTILITIIPMAILNLILYLLGSFVAWSFDPSTWWLVNSTVGRLLLVFIEISFLANVPKFWEEFDL